MSSQVHSKAVDERPRLLPKLLAEYSRHDPKRLFAAWTKSSKVEEDGFEEVNFDQVGRASNHVSQWLQQQFDLPTQDPIMYIGVPDIRYNLVFYATLKLRLKLFLPSARNTSAVNIALLKVIGCKKIIYSPELEPAISALQQLQPELQCVALPSVADILSQPTSPYTYEHRWEDVFREHVLILHSSGSTGTPKVVQMTHGTFATTMVGMPAVPGRVNWDLTILDFDRPESLFYTPFPPSHVAGFTFQVVIPIINRACPLFGPPTRPPSGPLAMSIMRLQHDRLRAMILPPTVVEELYQDPASLELVKSLDFICFAGGPLGQAVGDEMSKHVAVCQFYGSTEMGQSRQLFPRRENWAYFELHPQGHQEMQKIEGDEEHYELVINISEATKDIWCLNHNFPDLKEWRTKDIFTRHPTNPDLWKFHGRLDDIIVFSNGEKLYPVFFESQLAAFPGVTGALMVGNGRPRAGLLLELKANADSSADPLDQLWPRIEQANKGLATQGRVSRQMVVVASPEKPFARAGKGTVMRWRTEQLYSVEIEAVFANDASSSGITLASDLTDEKAITDLLRQILNLVQLDPNISEDENFYGAGMDSIKTVEMLQHLRSALKASRDGQSLGWLTLDLIYVNCTIVQLRTVIHQFLNHGVLPQQLDAESVIRATIDKYSNLGQTQSPPALRNGESETSRNGLSVALTGTTGYLGSNIVESLLSNSRIAHVFCLNRNKNAAAKWEKTHRSLDPKLRFFTVDLSLPNIGLSGDELRAVTFADLLIHNAWPVNFNQPITAFEPSFQGIVNLIKLCSDGSHKTSFFFTSSISSAGPNASSESASADVPEGLISDASAPMPMGYAQSKYVAEHIVHAAASALGVRATILRVGLVSPSAGSDAAATESPDVVTALLRTCRRLKIIPSDFVPVDWITLEQTVSTVVDLIPFALGEDSRPAKEEARIFNLVNPHALAWGETLTELSRWCGAQARVVPMVDWIRLVEESAGAVRVEEAPALKMLEVFKLFSGPGLKSARSTRMDDLRGISKTVATMEPVRAELLRAWFAAVRD